MVRSAAVGFGALTMLALAGNTMLGGQPLMGTRHLQTDRLTPVNVIQDKPVTVPGPAQSIVTAPSPSPRRAPSTSPASTPSSRTKAHPRPVAPRPQSVPVSAGQSGQSLGVGQLLQLAQPAIAGAVPGGGPMNAGSLLPALFQQFTDPAAAASAPAPAEPAQPQILQGQVPAPAAQAAPNPANAVPPANGGGRDAGDGWK